MENKPLAIQLYTPKQASTILAINEETVRRYVRQGKIKYIRLGGKFIRIRYSDLEKFINSQKSKLSI